MAPPALLDGQHPHWCSYGCLGCWYGCHCPPTLNKWVPGETAGRRFTVPCRPPCLRHLHHPPHPPPAPRHGDSTRGRAEGSWTGCSQRRDLSTDVRNTLSSERGSSRDFLPDTRFTGESGAHLYAGVYLCCYVSLFVEISKQKETGRRISVSQGTCLFLTSGACLPFWFVTSWYKTNYKTTSCHKIHIFEPREVNERGLLRQSG